MYVLEHNKEGIRVLTTERASFKSKHGWLDQDWKVVWHDFSMSGRKTDLRFSGPYSLRIKVFRYLYMNPWREPTLYRPNTSVNVSGYQLSNSFPSCFRT